MSTKNYFLVIFCLLLCYGLNSQTEIIAYQNHSGNLKHFKASMKYANFGLPPQISTIDIVKRTEVKNPHYVNFHSVQLLNVVKTQYLEDIYKKEGFLVKEMFDGCIKIFKNNNWQCVDIDSLKSWKKNKLISYQNIKNKDSLNMRMAQYIQSPLKIKSIEKTKIIKNTLNVPLKDTAKKIDSVCTPKDLPLREEEIENEIIPVINPSNSNPPKNGMTYILLGMFLLLLLATTWNFKQRKKLAI